VISSSTRIIDILTSSTLFTKSHNNNYSTVICHKSTGVETNKQTNRPTNEQMTTNHICTDSITAVKVDKLLLQDKTQRRPYLNNAQIKHHNQIYERSRMTTRIGHSLFSVVGWRVWNKGFTRREALPRDKDDVFIYYKHTKPHANTTIEKNILQTEGDPHDKARLMTFCQ